MKVHRSNVMVDRQERFQLMRSMSENLECDVVEVEVRQTVGANFIFLFIKGYGEYGGENGQEPVVGLSFSNGNLEVHVNRGLENDIMLPVEGARTDRVNEDPA